jgi:hypothetical protein
LTWYHCGDESGLTREAGTGMYPVERTIDEDGTEAWWIGGDPDSYLVDTREAVDEWIHERGIVAPRDLSFKDDEERADFIARFGY